MAAVVNNECVIPKKNKVVVKVGLLGDVLCGRKSLMLRYVEDKWDEDYEYEYIPMFMEKTIYLKNVDVTISLWYLKGQREFVSLMPLVCCDAKIILFLFDLTQKQTLFSVKRWYKEARVENKSFMPFLIGTKYDLFEKLDETFKVDISEQARKYAQKMHSPLIYCSSAESINIKEIFNFIIAKMFDLQSKNVKEEYNEREKPLIEDYSKLLDQRYTNYLVYGYIREHGKVFLLNIPDGIIEICYLLYCSTKAQATRIEKFIGKTKKVDKKKKGKKKKKKKRKKKKQKVERVISIITMS